MTPKTVLGLLDRLTTDRCGAVRAAAGLTADLASCAADYDRSENGTNTLSVVYGTRRFERMLEAARLTGPEETEKSLVNALAAMTGGWVQWNMASSHDFDGLLCKPVPHMGDILTAGRRGRGLATIAHVAAPAAAALRSMSGAAGDETVVRSLCSVLRKAAQASSRVRAVILSEASSGRLGVPCGRGPQCGCRLHLDIAAACGILNSGTSLEASDHPVTGELRIRVDRRTLTAADLPEAAAAAVRCVAANDESLLSYAAGGFASGAQLGRLVSCLEQMRSEADRGASALCSHLSRGTPQ